MEPIENGEKTVKYLSFFLLVLPLLLVGACSKKAEVIPEKQMRSIKSIQVKKSFTLPRVKVSGLTKSKRTVELAFRISGVIDKVGVELGDIVKKDQVLATLESTDFQLQLEQTRQSLSLAKSRLTRIKAKARPEELASGQARVRSAEKSYENARRLYDSQINLARSQITSEIELDKLRTQSQIAQEETTIAKQNLILLEKGARVEEIQLAIEEVSSSKIEVRIAQQNLQYLQLKTPFRGIITDLPIEAKEFISSGKNAVVVDDLYKIKLEVFVPASQVSQVSLNQKVDVFIESTQAEKYPGLVNYIASKAETISKTFSVEIEIANPELKIRAGMFANAEIHIGNPKETILIPPQCLQEDLSGTYVLIVGPVDKKNTAKVSRRDIKIGKLSQGSIEIREGLKENEWIAIEGQHYASPGSNVFVTPVDIDH